MNRNTPGPTEIQVRAMAAILAHPQVWQLKHVDLFAVASAATNGKALRGRVLGTMEKIRTERRLMGAENTPGGTEIHQLAMGAILSHPQVWFMGYEQLHEIANEATNHGAKRWRVKGTVNAMRRERGLEPLTKGT
jgi:dihydrodipicolinate reductase